MEILAILAALLGMILLAIGILVVRDKATRRERTPEELELEEHEWNARLSGPNWPFVEAEFAGVLPEVVKRLHGDPRILLRRNVQVGDVEIARFVPADDDAFDCKQWRNIPEGSFVIAMTQFGDPLFVNTAEDAPGFPVYLYYHDGGDTEIVAPSLENFVAELHRAV